MWRVSSILELSGLNTAPIPFTEAVRERGTAVHRAAESLAQGFTPDVDPDYQGYVDGVVEWYRTIHPEVVAIERRIVNHTLQLTGRLDIVVIENDAPTIVDVKTGGESHWHGIQTGGYHMLACEDDELWQLMGDPWAGLSRAARYQRMRRANLYLPGDGGHRWRPKLDSTDLYLFRAALALQQYRFAHGLSTYVDPENPDEDTRTMAERPELETEVF
jgi:hypothetical protein